MYGERALADIAHLCVRMVQRALDDIEHMCVIVCIQLYI